MDRLLFGEEVVAERKTWTRNARLLERAGLTTVLVVAAGMRLWGLGKNGFGNPYYAASVRSTLEGWSNFFFGAFDPPGFVTVDKPPVAIWIQSISAKLFGYHGLSLLVPQALMGVASVALTYHLVRRIFGAGAGLIAGLVLAVTPICVAVDRDNLPDSALVLDLLLASWALFLAMESGRLKPLLISAALVGVGFNIKMLAAFVVLPTFYLCYLVATPIGLTRRLVHLAVATLVLFSVSLSWSIAVELTPKSHRPYIGGSTNNSALELALGYNGLGRVFGGSGNFRPGGGPGPGGPGPRGGAGGNPFSPGDLPRNVSPEDAEKGLPPMPFGGPGMGFPPGGMGGAFPPGGPGNFGPGGMPPMFGGTPGFFRFARPLMAAQITWLFPLAIAGAIVAMVKFRQKRAFGREQVSILFWAGWLGTHWIVFSLARGIFHEYYTTIMGPAVAALTGIGVTTLASEWKRGEGRGHLPMALVMTAGWQAFIVSQSPELSRWLLPVIGIGTMLCVLGLLGIVNFARKERVSNVNLLTGIGVATLMIGPACWSLSTVIGRGNSLMPAATPAGLTGRPGAAGMPPMMPPDGMDEGREKLVAFLRANRAGAKYFIAAPSSMEVGSIIIQSGENAISFGGFMGGDPVLDVDQFSRMIKDGQLRFVMLGGGPGGGPPPGPGGMTGGGRGPGGPGGPPMSSQNAEILAWVRKNGKPVKRELWQSDEPPRLESGGGLGDGMGMARMMRQAARLYDCRPELGWKTASE